MESKLTVLVVDDDKSFLDTVAEYLQSAGYNVLATSNAAEAWKLLTDVSIRVDAIVCDIELPHQSGTSFLNKVRATGFKAPTILITGHFDLDHEAAKTMGAEAALVKPFDLKFLAGMIRSHIGSAGNKSA